MVQLSTSSFVPIHHRHSDYIQQLRAHSPLASPLQTVHIFDYWPSFLQQGFYSVIHKPMFAKIIKVCLQNLDKIAKLPNVEFQSNYTTILCNMIHHVLKSLVLSVWEIFNVQCKTVLKSLFLCQEIQINLKLYQISRHPVVLCCKRSRQNKKNKILFPVKRKVFQSLEKYLF